MRCFLGSGQKAVQAMLSISRTYENTADYKIQTHSERFAASKSCERALAPKLLENVLPRHGLMQSPSHQTISTPQNFDAFEQ